MKRILLCLGLVVLIGCASKKELPGVGQTNEFVIAFGSCNKATLDNFLWDDILNENPNIWVWGGDIVYADTDNMDTLRAKYANQDKILGYRRLKNKVPVIGTWDDHDYGINDGGVEFKAKKESQQEFLDFMDVPKESPRREQEGVYAAHDFELPDGKVKIIILDTRYFRTALTSDTGTKKRNKPNAYGEGTILGQKQWQWLENELQNSKADFNILISSIQFLSNKHGFECWGNFPHEVDRLKGLISNTNAKGVLILSGDRHISEFSRTDVTGMEYPLVDFTSSGLTHAYRNFTGEENPYRVGDVVATESYGILKLNLKSKMAHMKMMGDNGELFGELQQSYE
ncbi:alkaline phosphatase D family protein [Maribacter sp. 2210JD10-5]|uniref:alkaline phosphatase D family protein n=1 Tax=Maribacter sp. 2210JD10-5 TaxID=3386272 RepID=UPI0039BC8CB3